MRNTTSFVPSDLSRGYRENRTTGQLEFARDSDELYDAGWKQEDMLQDVYYDDTSDDDDAREIQLLIRTQKKNASATSA